MDILDPLFASAGGEGRPGRVVIGTVQGDVHDIGKNMVITMLKGSGYEIIDLGVNVATPDFVNAVRQHRPDILALSALLLTTRAKMTQVINGLVEAGLRSDVRVLVGGCPVDQNFADQIGADGYGRDAIDAVGVANRLVSQP
jgi:5-methyltetrahydrofolate--homocysteine methyltransferase